MAENLFAGKTVIVTGSSSGIGRDLAVNFAQHGASLVLTGRDLENLHAAKNECINAGLKENQVIYVAGDITEKTIQENIINAALHNFHKIDILINNAGITIPDNVNELNIENYDKLHDVNLRSVIALTILALPHLKATKGNIINISSIASLRPLQTRLFYGITKAGLDKFTKHLAYELAPFGVRVNAVNPGVIPTNIRRLQPPSPELLDKLRQLHPMKRVGTLKEVTDAVLFLASDKSSFTTGVIMPIDGGVGTCGVSVTT